MQKKKNILQSRTLIKLTLKLKLPVSIFILFLAESAYCVCTTVIRAKYCNYNNNYHYFLLKAAAQKKSLVSSLKQSPLTKQIFFWLSLLNNYTVLAASRHCLLENKYWKKNSRKGEETVCACVCVRECMSKANKCSSSQSVKPNQARTHPDDREV